MEAIEAHPQAPTPQAAALVAYARAIGLKAGDVQSLTLKGPDGAVLAVVSARRSRSIDQALNIPFCRPVSGSRPASAWLRSRDTAYAKVVENCGLCSQVSAPCPPLETAWNAGSSIDQSRASSDRVKRGVPSCGCTNATSAR